MFIATAFYVVGIGIFYKLFKDVKPKEDPPQEGFDTSEPWSVG